jgi:hypothetical protein
VLAETLDSLFGILDSINSDEIGARVFVFAVILSHATLDGA